MYTFNGTLTDDLKGSFTGTMPAVASVGSSLEILYKTALKLEDIYSALQSACSIESDNDIYIIYADIEEILDDIDIDTLKSVCENYQIGVIGSKAEHWIIGPLLTLSGSTATNGKKEEESIIDNLRELVDECEIISNEDLELLCLNVRHTIAAIYTELFNTYDLNDWRSSVNIGKGITRGFNEFLTRVNMSPTEIADELYWKILDEDNSDRFVFITNEVDRDPNVGRQIREMVHVQLRDRFEEVIEYITKEQVEDILNGKIKITESFIVSLENDDMPDGYDE